MTRRMFTVALVGPDGAGKTTVARRLEEVLGLPVDYLYMGVSADSSNRLLPTTRLAHALKRRRGARPDTAGPRDHAAVRPPAGGRVRRARRSLRAGLRLANRLAEEWHRQLLAARSVRRGSVVLFDRHFFADYHAYDVVGADRTLSRRLHGWLLAHAYPKPDLVVCLDAPGEVLHARKGEGSAELLERRRRDYLRLREVTERFEVVDATQPLDDVAREVARAIRSFEAERA